MQRRVVMRPRTDYATTMSSPSERRGPFDRRINARGGRRPQDPHGTAPLVLVVGDGGAPQRESEAILRELKFAVAPASNIQEALRVIDGLHPDLILARAEEASQLRDTGLPIVEYTSQDTDGTLVDRLRDAIRRRVQNLKDG